MSNSDKRMSMAEYLGLSNKDIMFLEKDGFMIAIGNCGQSKELSHAPKPLPLPQQGPEIYNLKIDGLRGHQGHR